MGPDETSEVGGTKKRYVRRLTEARREQNRRAQKAFRQKQKEELQLSQQKTGYEILSRKHELASKQACETSSSDLPSVATGDCDHLQPREVDSRSQGSHDLEDPIETYVATRLNAIERYATCHSPSMMKPQQDPPAVLTTLAPAVFVPADPSVVNMRGMWPVPHECYQQTYTLPERPKSLSRPFSVRHTLHSGRPPSRRESSRPNQYLQPQSPSALPDPYINHLQILGESCFAATMAIALSLGINRPSYINDHPSPFSLAPLADYARISADLQPTFEQRTLVHPCYLDCIIFPNFRSRAIELSSRGELDHCSLFLDLMHDGLVCWGSQYASADYGRSMSDSVPWSRQSWEARPWFLKKWGFLVGDRDSDCMLSTSRWWSTMRGETELSVSTIEEVGSVFSRHGGCNVGVRQMYDDPIMW